MNPQGGVIVLDKPSGITSNGALGKLKHLLGRPKMGFLGTLDPLATGVLPVFIGKATKLISEFEGLDKTYRATLRLGESTDSYDADGAVVSRAAIDQLREDEVQSAVMAFQGEFEQRPPDYSAIKHEGVPAYRLARQGKPVPEKRRTVWIENLAIESIALPDVTFTLRCSAGTYVRSLAHDIGTALGVGAHILALRRLACGACFTVEESILLENIGAAVRSENWEFLRDAGARLPGYLSYPVLASEEAAIKSGNRLPLREEIAPGTRLRAISERGDLLAVGKVVSTGRSELGFQPDKVLV